MLNQFLVSVDIKVLMWILPTIFFAHEMEEWNILDWYKTTYSTPPSSTKLSCRIWLFAISILGFIITSIAYILPNKTASAGVLLVFIVFTTFNGIQHIFWAIAFKKYAPGVVFSSLGIAAGIFVTAAALSQGLVSAVYVVILYAITVPLIIETFKARNTLIRSFRFLHNFTLKIVDFLER